jgi:hypothetical protein
MRDPFALRATQCWASKELGSPSLRVQDFGQRWGNPLASPELTWQAEGSGFRHQKISREESGPVRGGAFVLGRSESSSCRTPVVGKGGVHGQEEPPTFLRDMQPDEDL